MNDFICSVYFCTFSLPNVDVIATEIFCLPHTNIDQPRLVSTSTILLPTFLDLIPNSVSASHKNEPCVNSSLRLTSPRTPLITNFVFLIRRERKGKNDPLSLLTWATISCFRAPRCCCTVCQDSAATSPNRALTLSCHNTGPRVISLCFYMQTHF